MATQARTSGGPARFVPIVGWLPRYERKWLRGDVTAGIALRLARVKPNVLSVLRADGVVELVGADHIHGNVNRAIEAELAAESGLTPEAHADEIVLP